MLMLRSYSKFYRVCLVYLGLALLSLSNSSQADLISDFNQRFNTNMAFTSPNSYELASRGVYTGGSLYLRNHIQQLQLFSLTPPHISAGCGGIDFYAGSFSYINKEGFNQLLRSVASNAMGYSFSLAMNQMCPSCGQVIETAQQKIQSFNQYLGNSCQLAKGVVNGGLQALNSLRNNEVSLSSLKLGQGDALETLHTQASQKRQEAFTNQENSTVKNLTGNLIFKALRQAGYSQSLSEDIMSIVGTIIISKEDGEFSSRTYAGKLISLENLLNGKQYQKYNCLSADCTSLSIVNLNNNSITQRIQNLYLGNNVQMGVIDIYAQNQGQLNAEQRTLLSHIGMGINGHIRSLVLQNVDAARDYANYSSQFAAYSFIKEMIEEAFSISRQYLANIEENPNSENLRNMLNTNETNYLLELQQLGQKYNPLNIQIYYNNLYKNLNFKK